MDLFDAHIHPFIDPADSIAPYGNPESTARMFDDLKRAGVTECAGSVVSRLRGKPESWDIFNRQNEDALKVRDLYLDYYHPGLQISEFFAEESARAVEAWHDQYGCKFIGELVPYMHGGSGYNVPGLRPAFERAEALGMTVSIHPSAIEDMDGLLTAFPQLRIVIAHPGEKDHYLQVLALLEKHPNAYLDFSGTGTFRYGMVRYGVDQVGSKRFIFGSDFPICNGKLNSEGILYERLTGAELDDIFSLNIRRLLA